METHLDVEYQTYRLLAYLQHVEKCFTQIRLYPYLRDLIKHYEFIDNISSEMNRIKQRLGYDIDDEVISYVYEMADIIKTETKKVMDEGVRLFNVVLESIFYEPIGIIPEYKDDGYIIASYDNMNYIDVLRFEICKLVDIDTLYITNVEFIERLSNVSCLFRAPEFIKGYLLDKYKGMPNPLVLYVRAGYYVPLHETFIPIIKRVLPVWVKRI
jgi:hypothetical protein